MSLVNIFTGFLLQEFLIMVVVVVFAVSDQGWHPATQSSHRYHRWTQCATHWVARIGGPKPAARVPLWWTVRRCHHINNNNVDRVHHEEAVYPVALSCCHGGRERHAATANGATHSSKSMMGKQRKSCTVMWSSWPQIGQMRLIIGLMWELK